MNGTIDEAPKTENVLQNVKIKSLQLNLNKRTAKNGFTITPCTKDKISIAHPIANNEPPAI